MGRRANAAPAAHQVRGLKHGKAGINEASKGYARSALARGLTHGGAGTNVDSGTLDQALTQGTVPSYFKESA